jgi:hypothetical protein
MEQAAQGNDDLPSLFVVGTEPLLNWPQDP